ncbi:MAG: SIR2 family NAD-dependent protein deacylase [Acutalibacteraceae bacterium]
MFSKSRTTKSTGSFSENINRLSREIQTADAVVIGAGAGLSTAAGFTYCAERFERYFADFHKKYGITDMYCGGFYPYKTPEEYWAYWSRYVYINRYLDVPTDLYDRLLDLVKEKDYFVITTNVDHCFQKAGFAKERLFYTQGDYGLFQCSEPCCNETWDNEKVIKAMLEQQKDMRIPCDLLPVCPRCGKPLTMNLRCDDSFVQDNGWYAAKDRYKDFIFRHNHSHVLFLELGVGMNTPVIIKFPFWQMTKENSKAVYACVNLESSLYPEEIERQTICLQSDISKVLTELQKTFDS